MLRLTSLLGLVLLLGLCVLLSRDRRAISWRLVGAGMLLQLLLGGVFLYWDTGNAWLRSIGHGVKRFLDLSQDGAEFVFGPLAPRQRPVKVILRRGSDGAPVALPGHVLEAVADDPHLVVTEDPGARTHLVLTNDPAVVGVRVEPGVDPRPRIATPAAACPLRYLSDRSKDQATRLEPREGDVVWIRDAHSGAPLAAAGADGAFRVVSWLVDDPRERDGARLVVAPLRLAAGLPPEPSFSPGFVFATQILPTLIFFSAFMAVLYHLGIMQAVVRLMAVVMARVMGTSGAESLSACGNVFVGQTEAPLMVRPYLPRMTMSELHAVMTGGFATIAGGVFALYVGFGADPGHLIVASVMAVPAGLVCSKILWPETEESETMGKVVRAHERTTANIVDAAAHGATDGLKLALNVAAMLIAFLGLVAVLDWLLGFVDLSVGRILGWVFYPIAAVMGVQGDEIPVLARLLGTKIALTELIAYGEMGELERAGAISPRTLMIATFALCGFANFGSVAIQIGGLGAMAPERRTDLSRLALRAMVAGAIATCLTASMAGVLRDA